MSLVHTPDQWSAILKACGVGSITAGRWSVIFADVVTDSSFSLGDRELPDFLGTILVESQRLERLEENLYYTKPERLMEVWPSRFPSVSFAAQYTKNPKKLADYVYGERLGNINGDGYTYRGSGLVMVTGLGNFRAVELATGLPVVSQPELLRTPRPALELSIRWWEGRVPDAVVGNRKKVRRAVNGGEVGLQEVVHATTLAEAALQRYVA